MHQYGGILLRHPKRGIYGTFDRVYKKEVHRYCSEFDFRWTSGKVSDSNLTKADYLASKANV